MEGLEIKNSSGDAEMLWETIGKPAYEKGLLEGRQEPGLFAIIPMSILESKTLSANAKLLYGEIMALSKKSGKCYATNEYLSEMIGLSKTSMPQIIRELSGCGLILVDIQRSKKGTYRNITVSFFNKEGYSQITKGGIVKEQGQKRNRQKEIDKVSSSAIAVGNEVNEIIKLFEPLNPSYSRIFKNTTERASIERMIKSIGAEKLLGAIKFAAVANGMPYAPTVTTPLELERNLGKLIAFYNKENGKVNKITSKIAWMPTK